MNGNFPFKFWCHKVLPLVYDDSISYYEFLCKLAKLVNDISKHNEEQDKAISNNNAYIVKLDNEVHNDIVPHLENEITGLEQTLSADIRNLAMRIGFTPYSSEQEYHIGEYCLYLNETADYEETLRYGIPYLCTRETRGEFDETAWIETSVSGELNKNYSEITDLHKKISWVAKKFGALPYDKEHNYNVGDFCLFNDVGSSEDSTLIYGNIYRCKENTTGEFDSTKWEMINLLQFVERIWSETLVPFADKYDEEHTWNVNDIVLYGGDEVYGNTGGMPIIYRCINQTTGAFNYNDWTPLRFSWILDEALDAKNSATSALETCDVLTADYQHLSNTVGSISQSLNELDTKVFYGFNSIASNYQEYSGTPLFYPKDSYVWYLNVLYKANADVTVDSASVLPPDQNSSWDSVQLTDEIGSGESGDVDLNNIYKAIGVQIDKVGFQINVPKYTIGYTENALNGRQLYYANKDTTAGAGYEPNDWTLLSSVGLYGWVQLMLGEVNRYSEVISSEIVSEN